MSDMGMLCKEVAAADRTLEEQSQGTKLASSQQILIYPKIHLDSL